MQLRRNPQLLALDLDGTIVGSNGLVSPCVEAGLDMVCSDGETTVVIATGRSKPEVDALAKRFPALSRCWHVTSNGAAGYRPAGHVRFWSRRTRVHRSLEHLASRAPDVVVTADLDMGFYPTTRILAADSLPGDQRLMSWPMMRTLSCTRIFVRTTSLSVAELTNELQGAGYGIDVYESDAAVWADVMHPLASKSSALEALRARVGVAVHDTMAVGDSWNDIDAIAWAGTGVAMGDAPHDVIAVADFQLRSCADDGVEELLIGLVRRSRGELRPQN